MTKFHYLTEEELLVVEGGLEAITIAMGLGSLFIASANLGYNFGKDLASRNCRRR